MDRLRRFLRKPLKDKIWSLRAHLAPWLPLPIRLPFGVWWLVWYDSVSDRIFHGCYEPKTQRFIRNYLKPGMTVIDVGAHHGFYTLLAACCVGPTGKVIAFEPSPKERRKLLWHVWLNRCRQVQVEPFALSDTEGTMDLYLTHDNSANSLSPPNISPITGKVSVPVTTLAKYCELNGIEFVDLIKVDAEGAELFVLKGAKGLLERNPRPAIVVEVNRRTVERFGYTVDTLLGFLESKGFRCFLVPDEINAIAIPIEQFKEPSIAAILSKIA